VRARNKTTAAAVDLYERHDMIVNASASRAFARIGRGVYHGREKTGGKDQDMDDIGDLPRFELTRLDAQGAADDGADVIAGLGGPRKSLPCKYFYDARGSELFERICATAEYYPTRTERAILEACAGDIAEATGAAELVELGSGSARKTRVLLEAYSARAPEVHFAPIDVSGDMLVESARELIARYDDLTIRGIAGTYEDALAALHPAPHDRRMFLFLGSTIGNFTEDERGAFLARIHAAMAPGDFFLLGFDRVKDAAILHAAYNDAEGATAAFNRNILAHLNARFHGDFRPGRFRHVALWNADESRIEIYLESDRAQAARLDDIELDAAFESGERIHTEISRKFEPDAVAAELAGLGFVRRAEWTDARDWFSLMLFGRGEAA
jgi:dimethylhistidine N-methyltransferase